MRRIMGGVADFSRGGRVGAIVLAVDDRFKAVATDKKHVVEPTGHFVAPAIATGETLDWLDKYLGPVD